MRMHDIYSMKGKVVIITGGAGFLGMQYAKGLLSSGATVVLWDKKNESVLNTCKKKLQTLSRRPVTTAQVDITDETDLKGMYPAQVAARNWQQRQYAARLMASSATERTNSSSVLEQHSNADRDRLLSQSK